MKTSNRRPKDDSVKRTVQQSLNDAIKAKKSVLVLGPRQVGKTTLLKTLGADLNINLTLPRTKLKYEKNPSLLVDEVKSIKEDLKRRPLVYIDEIQKVPTLLDAIQVLIDDKEAQFLLSGSSARKLKREADTNLLPGRLLQFRLDAFSLSEIEAQPADLDSFLSEGLLPAVYLEKSEVLARMLLRTYVETYLEEEIRKEALVKQLGHFSRFIELAALDSGQVTNFSKVGGDLGVAPNTVKGYYDILHETLIAERIDPITESASRKKLTKASKFLFFDLGVRRYAAREAARFTPERKGQIFEQFVGIEIIKILHQTDSTASLHFWRDPDGPEVDWVVKYEQRFLPIEVKMTTNPRTENTKHLKVFENEHDNSAKGIVICNAERRLKLSNGVTCYPWWELSKAIESFLGKT